MGAEQPTENVVTGAVVKELPKKPRRPFASSKDSDTVTPVSEEKKEEKKPKEDPKEKSSSSKAAKTVTQDARDHRVNIEKQGGGSKYLNISSREKIMFSKHLSVMLDSGIPLREALEVMAGQVSSKPLQRMLNLMMKDLSDGFTLSSTLEKFPRVFKPFSINIIRVGESSGTLPNALKFQAIQLEKSRELEGKVKSALLYPIIIFVGAIGIASYLSFFILPKMIPMFNSLNVKLPGTTLALLAISNFVLHKWPLLIAIVVALGLSIFFLYRVRAVKFTVHKLILHIPVFGNLLRTIQVAFFTRILGILLTSGVQIVQAIAVTSDSASNLVYRKQLRAVAENVERGEAITSELERYPNLFPKITVGMIKVGDRTGRLAESLMTAAEFSEKEVDDLTRNLSTLIEPLTLLFVGGLVGFIALSIITPIYQITQGIK
ncbi:MAG: type II secretion system F family protein [Candidatus Uhrbacteria bacterium]|nr:type II secretion system F family protein [Candidatus Uhrbacteria bacterium]